MDLLDIFDMETEALQQQLFELNAFLDEAGATSTSAAFAFKHWWLDVEWCWILSRGRCIDRVVKANHPILSGIVPMKRAIEIESSFRLTRGGCVCAVISPRAGGVDN